MTLIIVNMICVCDEICSGVKSLYAYMCGRVCVFACVCRYMCIGMCAYYMLYVICIYAAYIYIYIHIQYTYIYTHLYIYIYIAFLDFIYQFTLKHIFKLNIHISKSKEHIQYQFSILNMLDRYFFPFTHHKHPGGRETARAF